MSVERSVGPGRKASDIAFTPAGTVAATDVQAAIEEVAAEAGGGLIANPGNSWAALTPVADGHRIAVTSGGFTGTWVFEATDPFTTGAVEPTWDDGVSLPLFQAADVGTWLLIGQVGDADVGFVQDAAGMVLHEQRVKIGGEDLLIEADELIRITAGETLRVDAGGSLGVAGQALVSDGNEKTVWGEAGLVVDPGNVWVAETVVPAGHRIAVFDGVVTTYVYETPLGGTTAAVEPTWTDGFLGSGYDFQVPDDGTVENWFLLGRVGALEGLIDNGSGISISVAGQSTVFGEDVILGADEAILIKAGESLRVDAGGGLGVAGQALVSNGDEKVVWGELPVLMTTVNLSSAQLLNLHDTAVEILPAGGGRFYHVIHNVVGHFRAGATPYNESAVSIDFGWGSLADIRDSYQAQIQGGDWPTLAVDVYKYGEISTPTLLASAIENVAVSAVFHEETPITGGDGAFTIRLWYSLIDGAL